MKKIVLTSLALGSLALGSAAMAQELPKTSLKVVGGLSNLTAYQNTEQPFWSKKVPELSGGQITADIKGFNDMGLKGPEIMRLIGQGVIPFGTATLAYFASDNSINEAIDLAGLAPDIEVAKKLTDAFTPAYEQFYAKNNVKVLGFSTYPAQVLFCNGNFNGLSDRSRTLTPALTASFRVCRNKALRLVGNKNSGQGRYFYCLRTFADPTQLAVCRWE